MATFFGTKHNLKEYARDKIDELKSELHKQQLQMTELKAKDDLQEQVIEQINKQLTTLIPRLFEALSRQERSKHED